MTKHLMLFCVEGKSLSILFSIVFYIQHCIVYLRGMTKHLMLFCIEGKSLSILFSILFYIQRDQHCIVHLRGMTKHLILSCTEGKSLSISYLILFYPPAPMNHAKIFMLNILSPPEMPPRNWYNSGTKHFHPTLMVGSK